MNTLNYLILLEKYYFKYKKIFNSENIASGVSYINIFINSSIFKLCFYILIE